MTIFTAEPPVAQTELATKPQERVYEPASWQELKDLLTTLGIYDMTARGDFGQDMSWNDAKVQKLFEDYQKGERTFLFVSPIDAEKNKVDHLVTTIHPVSIEISYTNPRGEKLRLQMHILTITETLDANGAVLNGTRKEDVATEHKNLSGKALKDEQPIDALYRELSQELEGLTPDQIECKQILTKLEEKPSGGYPGLLTRFFITRFEGIMKDAGYKETYKELKSKTLNTEGNIQTTTYHYFNWTSDTKVA